MPINPEGGFETELERDIRMSRKRYANRVYTNANKLLVDQRFRVFHCKRCTSYVLITDADIQTAPRRRTDNALVFCPEKNFVKLRTKPVLKPVKVRRLKGLETQYFHACADCGLHIAYQSVPHHPPRSSTAATSTTATATISNSPAAEATSYPSVTPTTADGAAAAAAGKNKDSARLAVSPASTSSTVSSLSSAAAAASPSLACTQASSSSVHDAVIAKSVKKDTAIYSCSNGATTTAATTTAVTTVLPAPASSAPSATASSPLAAVAVPDVSESTGNSSSAAVTGSPAAAVGASSLPYIYLIDSAVIFPTKASQVRLRCRVCGFVPRNEVQFEEHKRDRGHWDQESGQFNIAEDSADTPINPIIVG